jgi:hypothetical protein
VLVLSSADVALIIINAHNEMGQMAVCSQNLTVCALSSYSALSVLVGALFKNFGLFLNMPCTLLLAILPLLGTSQAYFFWNGCETSCCIVEFIMHRKSDDFLAQC